MFQGVGFPPLRILFVSALIAASAVVSQAQQQPLLTRHVRQETLNGQAPLVGRMPAAQSMRLVLVLPHRNQAELDTLLKDLYDPTSASYRKFLTVDEFTAKFGPTQQDYDSVVRFAEANGLTVVGTSRNRMNIDVTGPVANVESAFHVTMGTYQHPTENRTFFAPDREPTPNLAVQLWHIAGLDNYSTPTPNLVRSNASAAAAQPNATTGTGPSAAYLGSDMRAAYYVNGNSSASLTGAGQSVGLFEFLGTDLADLTKYYTNAGQTNNVPITLKSVDTQSTSCVEPTCDDTEQTLDMTQVLGMAPGLSSLVMYIGNGGLSGQTLDDAGILNAMATASPLNAQLSSAWEWKPADPTTDDVYFEEFAAQGQTFFAATGDDGNWSHAEFVWPADSVYVTAVGGTDLTTTGAGGQWASETGWSDSGGGIGPDDFPIPSWQVSAAAGCPECSQTYRNGPDVAANANFTYYVCADQVACTANEYGGTSFAASIWAGYMALVNQQAVSNCTPPLGFINPALYTIGSGVDYDLDFHDITSGGNNLGTTVGYDLSTGWGSPNGSALLTALAGAPRDTFCISVSPTSVSVAQGASGTSTITTGIAGGFNSSIALSATGQPTGVTASFNPASIVAPGAGTSTLTLTVASSTVTGVYPITITGTGGSLTQSTTVNLTVIGAGQIAVPNVVGDTQAAATTAINGAGLVVGTVSTASSPTVPSGDVISQSPGAGAGANSSAAVNLVVSSGPAQSGAAATPVFSPAAGTYSSAQSVTITDSTSDAIIYYTTNGTTPTTSSPQYNGAIFVSATEAIEAIAIAGGYSQSAPATALYTIGAAGSGEWTWMNGSNTLNSAGTYGMLNTPAAGNTPGARDSASTWTDSSGHLWLFGGEGYGTSQTFGFFNDLWEFSPSNSEWAWMGGSSGVMAGYGEDWPGVYGMQGQPAQGNIPGGRYGATTWTDSSGHFWLFGGAGADASGNSGSFNDLWEFNPSTGFWTWQGGSSTIGTNGGQPGVYGMLNTPAAGNIPGARRYGASWADSNGNLWLFGGSGMDGSGAGGVLNDLWEFNPSTGYWTWQGGSSSAGSNGGQPAVYGMQGTPAAGNVPGGLYSAVTWTDSSGNFWLFGGFGFNANGNDGFFNDLWEFNPSTGFWTWVSGSNSVDGAADYGTLGTPAAGNTPGGRYRSVSWKDSSGNFWLFGGNGLDGSYTDGYLNDLWEFSPSTSQWTWMGGSSTIGNFGQPGVYGTQATPAAANIPGGRQNASAWTDNSGNFWLFGGYGENASDSLGDLNDLWSFQPAGPGTVGLTPAATPTFSLASGTYSTPQIVTISDATAGAAIYYTTNGNAPTTSSTLYNGAINVSATETIEAIAVASGYANSAVASATYTIQVNVPILVSVPYVVGDTQAAATTVITADRLVVGTVTTAISPTIASGEVISQSPGAGTGVNTGSAINLVVSSGSTLLAVPNVVGDTQAAATTAITAAGLVVGTVTPAGSPTVPSGNVLSESPSAGTSVTSGSAVILVVSTGPAQVSTTTSIAQSGSPGNYTLTATVVGSGNPNAAPTGTVSFLDTSNGNAVVATATLGVGTSGALNWTNTQTPVTEPAPQSIVVGDFNGDGIPDIAAGSNGFVSVLIGKGDGTFKAANNLTALGNNQFMATAAFVTGKPAGILTVSNSASSINNAELILGNGSGGETVETPFSLSCGSVSAVATGDFNGDGKPDFLVGCLESGNPVVAIFLGNGNGTFGSPTIIPVDSAILAIGVGNFRGNGKSDIAVVNAITGTSNMQIISIFENDGSGNFSQGPSETSTGTSPISMVVADFNGDGKSDFALLNNGGNNVTIMLSAGSGAFMQAASPQTGSSPSSIAVGDFNGDSIPDLAVANSGGNTVTILEGNGGGTFTAVATPATGNTPSALAVGDFIPGGAPGLAVANSGATGGSVTVLNQQTTQTATATATGVSPAGSGAHLVEASYPGDSNYAASVSGTTSLTGQTVSIAVPNVVGNTQAAATTAITAAGLVLGTVTQQSSPTVASGNVISETPTAGTSVNSGSAVNLVISSGPAQATVPNVVGNTQAAATTAITGAGLTLGTVTQQSSPTVASGNVISETPTAGTSVNSGSAVNLIVSTGPAQATVPNVVGNTQAAATTVITSAGLVLGTVTQQSSPTVASGSVISETPTAGTSVNSGSAVNLVISSGPAQATVPNVVGNTQAAATTAITGAGLTLGTVTQQSSPTIASGSVISESPSAGTSVNSGSAVNLIVSTGPAQATVPNVVGNTQAAATTAITAAGLVLGTVTQQSSPTVASGSVISESPTAGTSVNSGSAVNLVISSGPAQATVPNVVGDTQAAATTVITSAGLVLGTVTTASSPTVASGNVISESPTAGTSVNSGSAVNLVISSGPAQATVPNVVGNTQAAATTAITAAGLVLGTVTQQSSPTVASGNVISETPTAGTSVNSGSAVNLVISSGPAQAAVPNVVGDTQAAATTAITAAGLVLGTVTQQSSPTVASGNVISETPTAGTSVSSGSAVNLVISSGPAQATVPNVVGNTQAAATIAITGAGLVLGTVTQQTSPTVASGNVISESPTAGTSVNSGSAVNLVVSTGPAQGTPGFTLIANPSTLIIKSGSSASTVITLTPTGGFTGTVNFSCGTLPLRITCNFVPGSLTVLSNTTSLTTTLTIGTTGTATAALIKEPANDPAGTALPPLLAALVLLPLGLMRRILRTRKAANQWLGILLLAGTCLTAASLLGMAGCGGSSSSTPAGSYYIPISVTGNGATNTLNLSVTVE